MFINKSLLAIGLTIWLSLFIGSAVAQGQPQVAPKSKPKATVKAPSPEPTKAPVVAAPSPLPAPAVSHEFKLLGIDLLSGLDSMASAEMQGDLIYEPRLAEVEKLMNRAKYLADNDLERSLYPLAGLYLGQIVVCRGAVQIAQNKARIGVQILRGLGISGTSIEEAELSGQQHLSEDLEKNSKKCAEDNKKGHDSLESYIVRAGSQLNQPNKEEPRETKE